MDNALKVIGSNSIFNTLVDIYPYSIVVNDLMGKYVYGNRIFLKSIGAKHVSEIIGKSLTDLGFPLPDNQEEIQLELKLNGKVENIEGKFQYPNGSEVYFIYNSQIFNYEGENLVLTTTVDITERKKLEIELKHHKENLERLVAERTNELATALEELQATNEELNAANDDLHTQRDILESTIKQLEDTRESLIQSEKMASLGILTAGVAHEINNPLNYIHNGVQVIENYLNTNLPPQNQEYLKPFFNAITTGVERVTKIVRNLNRYSRNDELVFSGCNVADIIDNSLVKVKSYTKQDTVIEKRYHTQNLIIEANESKLQRVFVNILTNAFQAVEEGGLVIISSRENNGFLEISIKDNGPGISKEIIQRIFDPFFTTREPGKGTGLGLSVSQKIITQHCGTLSCNQDVTEGAEFIIKLPFLVQK